MVGDRGEQLSQGDPRLLAAIVQLHRVGPPAVVRIAAVSKNPRHAGTLAPEVILRLAGESIGSGLHESVGILAHPRVIDRQVVGHEIEDEAEADLSEARSEHGERLGPAQGSVHRVPVNGVRRADHIRCGEVGEDACVLGDKIRE